MLEFLCHSMRRQRARENASGGQLVLTPHVDGTSTDDEEPQSVVAKRKADLGRHVEILLCTLCRSFSSDDIDDDFRQFISCRAHIRT